MIAGKINYKTQWTIIMLVTRTITHTGLSTNSRTNIMMMRDETICNNNKYLCQSSPECPLCDGVKGTFITNVINERPMQYKTSLNKRVLTSLICIYGEGRESYSKDHRQKKRRVGG